MRDPNASSKRAYAWIFISALIGFVISTLIQLAFTGSFGIGASDSLTSGSLLGSQLLLLVCGAPIVAALSVPGLAISAGITQLIAGALGGTGTYSRLVYAFAAYVAPLTLITSVIASIPYVNCLNFPLGIYGIVLNVIAVKAVHQFGWGKAVASSVLIFAFLLVIVAVFVIIILALLGPAIGNVFSNIVENLGTPAP